MNGDAASRPPAEPCYGGAVAYGYGGGKDAAAPPVRAGSGTPNQYVYDERDNDDYKVFPPPGPGTVIESTGHGYGGDKDAAAPPVRAGRGRPNQYVYDERDQDDYKVFPPPGPGTVIESTGHGYTVVPMKVTRDDAPRHTSLCAIESIIQGYKIVAPPVRCYCGVAAHGYSGDYDDGTDDGSPPPVRSGLAEPNQYVYNEYDNDDYKVFPPPGPGTVIESTGHGYTIVPMKTS